MRARGIAAERALRGGVVLVEQTTEPVAPLNAPLAVDRRHRNRLEDRRLLSERAVRPMRVVMRDVLAQRPLQVLARYDQDPVETLAPDAADLALRVDFARSAAIGARITLMSA